MASLVVAGDSSGSVTLAAPAVAGTTTLTLPTTSGTLVVTGGAQTVQFAAGSAAAPSITFTGDTNTGIFSPSADAIAFTEGGVESMRIDANGNLGLGTTTLQNDAGYKTLSISGSSGGQIAFQTAGVTKQGIYGDATDFNIINTAAGYIRFLTNNSERMRIDSSGNVGIGTSSPTTKLDVNGNIAGGSINVFGTSTPANGINNVATNALGFFSNSTERMRIDSAGRVLVGITSAIDSMPLQLVSATAGQLLMRRSDASAGLFWRIGPDSSNSNLTVYNQAGTGVFILNGGTSWNGTSDERLKNIVGEISDAVDKTCSLRAVKFTWKNDESSKTRVGLIAQDLQKVLPEAVNENTEGYLGVAYTDTIPLLVAAIKEQQQIINDLKARIETLEAK